jgi:DNA-binding response OmpR family regulator
MILLDEAQVKMNSEGVSGKILVVDRDRQFTNLAQACLGDSGYQVEVTADEREALERMRQRHLDLVVLDPMLPGRGEDVCQRVRAISDIPMIVVSAEMGEAERIATLERGADDYVMKPMNPKELVARVKAVLRRTQGSGRGAAIVRLGDLEINMQQREVRVRGQEIDLRPKEYGILELLARRAGRVVSRDEILAGVWTQNRTGDERTLAVHVTNLRSKLIGSGVQIRVVRYVGYKLISD